MVAKSVIMMEYGTY